MFWAFVGGTFTGAFLTIVLLALMGAAKKGDGE